MKGKKNPTSCLKTSTVRNPWMTFEQLLKAGCSNSDISSTLGSVNFNKTKKKSSEAWHAKQDIYKNGWEGLKPEVKEVHTRPTKVLSISIMVCWRWEALSALASWGFILIQARNVWWIRGSHFGLNYLTVFSLCSHLFSACPYCLTLDFRVCSWHVPTIHPTLLGVDPNNLVKLKSRASSEKVCIKMYKQGEFFSSE